MTETLKTYQNKKSSMVGILAKLDAFLKKGNEFGLSIPFEFQEKLSHSIENIQGEKLKIALVGGFSEGKTSIAAAWLGKIDSSSMKISASESSNEVKVYEIDDDYVLIDTPGLYGYKEQENITSHEIEKYKDITKRYVSEAHIILYVMNSKNPIKESHRDDLKWLFRELNLLSRTVFVLSRFDEVADVEDERDYQYHLMIKKQNVIQRLTEFLNLSVVEQNQLNVVGVSANPFDEGVGYWLENPDEFQVLSHIKTLQDATNTVVKSNGGLDKIAEEARKSIFSDILLNEIPQIEKKQSLLISDIRKITDFYNEQSGKLDILSKKIIFSKINLKTIFESFFNDLIMQVQGSNLETITDFLLREIGEEGVIISSKVQSIFEQETNQINISLDTQVINFNAELDSVDSALDVIRKQGLGHLVKNVKLNNAHIVLARDGLVAGGKFIGVNFGNVLKFKPWGCR